MTSETRDLRRAVTERYGALARKAAASDSDTIPLIGGAADACCDDSCCVPAAGPSEADLSYVQRLYSEDQTQGLPPTVLEAVAGCGNPHAIAELRPGETVLDLGSGGGIDCFLASKQVGPGGSVIGVDMTPDMVSLARENATKVGAGNVTFKLGEIEDLPVADGSVDVVISNCVINLSTDKAQVFREAFRVLRPGGRLRVSDMVWLEAKPSSESDDASWAACVDGAILLDDYLQLMRDAGFGEVRAEPVRIRDGEALASAQVFGRKPS
jgi:SAM-dependent methyltransferase